MTGLARLMYELMNQSFHNRLAPIPQPHAKFVITIAHFLQNLAQIRAP